MALSAQNQSTSYVNLYYSIVQRAATRYFKEYYNSGEYQQPRTCVIHVIPRNSIILRNRTASNRCPNQPKRKKNKKKTKKKGKKKDTIDHRRFHLTVTATHHLISVNEKSYASNIVWPPVRRPRFAKTTSSRARAVYARFQIFPPSLLPSLWLTPTHVHTQATRTRASTLASTTIRATLSLSPSVFLSSALCPLLADSNGSPTRMTTNTCVHTRNVAACTHMRQRQKQRLST